MRINLFLLILVATSCGSLKKTFTVAGIGGFALGASGGALFSPNEESRDKNAYLFGLVGAGIGLGLAYLFSDDSNGRLKAPMLIDGPNEIHKDVPLFDFSPELKHIRPEVNFKPIKKYEVPIEKLPTQLQGKVKKQFIIEYQSEGRTLEIDNRTIEIGPFNAWEHVYEK